MGLHHKICHAIGGALDLPHAETHTVVLPRALAYNAPAVPDAMKTIAAALPYAEGDAVKGLDMLVSSLELPNALSDYGMAETDVVKVVERVLDAAYENPMPLLPDRVRLLVALCWKGSEASHGNL